MNTRTHTTDEPETEFNQLRLLLAETVESASALVFQMTRMACFHYHWRDLAAVQVPSEQGAMSAMGYVPTGIGKLIIK